MIKDYLSHYCEWTEEVWQNYKNLPKDWDSHSCELNYALTALSGEAGEVLNDWKKYLAGRRNIVETEEKLEDELGDVFYYWVRCCYALGVDPEDIAHQNQMKLKERFNK